MHRTITSIAAATVALLFSGMVNAQGQSEKMDQQCLSDTNTKYASCMASAGSNDLEQRQCQLAKDTDRVQCKKK